MQATKLLRQAGYEYLIIGLTGNVLDDDVAEYLDAGADMVIAKPLSMRVLELIINHTVTNGSQSIIGCKLVENSVGLQWVPVDKNRASI